MPALSSRRRGARGLVLIPAPPNRPVFNPCFNPCLIPAVWRAQWLDLAVDSLLFVSRKDLGQLFRELCRHFPTPRVWRSCNDALAVEHFRVVRSHLYAAGTTRITRTSGNFTSSKGVPEDCHATLEAARETEGGVDMKNNALTGCFLHQTTNRSEVALICYEKASQLQSTHTCKRRDNTH